MQNTEDNKLVIETIEGNIQSFDKLIKHYQKPIYNLALKMTRNIEDSKDLTQSIFIKTYNGLSGFNFKSKFSSWLYRIAVNEIITHKRITKEHESIQGKHIRDFASPETIYVESEDEKLFAEAINTLKPEHKILVILKYFEGLSYKDISDVLKLTEPTIKSRLFAARKQLKPLFEKNGIF